jgi:hypothetical protein
VAEETKQPPMMIVVCEDNESLGGCGPELIDT